MSGTAAYRLRSATPDEDSIANKSPCSMFGLQCRESGENLPGRPQTVKVVWV